MLGPGMHTNLGSPELQALPASTSPEFVATLHLEDAKLLISLCLQAFKANCAKLKNGLSKENHFTSQRNVRLHLFESRSSGDRLKNSTGT
jgi:hypothetical protein